MPPSGSNGNGNGSNGSNGKPLNGNGSNGNGQGNQPKKAARKRAPRKGEGRPRIKVDWDVVEGLARIKATLSEISAVLNISEDTLERACVREQKMSFADYLNQKGAYAVASLRRTQYQMAVGRPTVYDKENRVLQEELRPDKTMCIWLGKQWLGQRDGIDLTTAGKPLGLETPKDPYAALAAILNKHNISLTDLGRATTPRNGNGKAGNGSTNTR